MYRSGGQWKMLQSSSPLMMTILPRRLWPALQLGFRSCLKLLTQAYGSGCTVEYVMPSFHWILTGFLVSLHPCATLVVSRLRSELDWPQSGVASSWSSRVIVAANLLLLAAHHRLNRQLHAHPLRREPDPLFVGHVHARVVTLDQGGV